MMKKFLDKLAKTTECMNWRVDPHGVIRGWTPQTHTEWGNGFCPITAVYYDMFGVVEGTGNWKQIHKDVGLSLTDALRVVEAADSDFNYRSATVIKTKVKLMETLNLKVNE